MRRSSTRRCGRLRIGRGRVASVRGSLAGWACSIGSAIPSDYLLNARVGVKGTDRVRLTDSTGAYRLDNRPAGNVVNALALNEHRYAGNIKDVIAADAFGDVSEGPWRSRRGSRQRFG